VGAEGAAAAAAAEGSIPSIGGEGATALIMSIKLMSPAACTKATKGRCWLFIGGERLATAPETDKERLMAVVCLRPFPFRIH
jgi:hypothetical protein